MARVTLTVQTITRLGLKPTYAAAQTDGNAFGNTGREFLHVKAGATPVVVTVLTARTVDGQAVTNRTVTVTANEDRMIGPFPPAAFNQLGASGDVVHVNYDQVTTITVAAIRLG